jgi:hypothetical protein
VQNISIENQAKFPARKYSQFVTPGLITKAVPAETFTQPAKILRSASASEMSNIKSFLAKGNKYGLN